MAAVVRISDMTSTASVTSTTDFLEISRKNADNSWSTFRISVKQILDLVPGGGTGSTWSFGTGAPTGTGTNGAVYVNKSTGDLYTSDGTAWTLTMNIMGPTGANSRAASVDPSPCERPPTKFDDSLLGYAVADQWQHGGIIYSCSDATEGAAVWDVADSSGLPGDVFGSATSFAGGVRQVVTGYTGAAIDVKTTVAGAAKTTTINLLSTGLLDVAALGTAIAAADTDTFASVTKVYDQTGNGNHLTSTGSGGVYIGQVSIDGQPVMSWGYRNGPAGFVMPAGITTAKNSFFFGQLGRLTSCNSGDGAAPCSVVFGSSASNEVKFLQGYYEMEGYTHVVTDNASEVTIPCVARNDANAFAVYASSNAYSLLSGNESGSIAATPASTALTGGYIGLNATGNDFYAASRHVAQATAFIIANTSPSAASLAHFRASANRLMAYTPQVRDCLVTIGDSRTEGYQTYNNQCWPVLLQQRARMAVYNFAISGATTTQMLKSLTGVSSLRKYRNKVAVVWGGINDVAGGADAKTVVVPNLNTITESLRNLGFTVLVMQEAQGDNPPRAVIMDALQKGAIRPDIVADPWVKGKPMYDRSVQPDLYFTDYTHPSNGGHEVIADEIWNRISGFFSR